MGLTEWVRFVVLLCFAGVFGWGGWLTVSTFVKCVVAGGVGCALGLFGGEAWFGTPVLA